MNLFFLLSRLSRTGTSLSRAKSIGSYLQTTHVALFVFSTRVCLTLPRASPAARSTSRRGVLVCQCGNLLVRASLSECSNRAEVTNLSLFHHLSRWREFMADATILRLWRSAQSAEQAKRVSLDAIEILRRSTNCSALFLSVTLHSDEHFRVSFAPVYEPDVGTHHFHSLKSRASFSDKL